jgi:hypothetical protein
MTIRKAAADGFQALAALSVLGGIGLFLRMVWLAFHLPAGEIVGGLLFASITLAALLFIGWILGSRAASIRELGYPALALPIVSILFRTAGEIYAALGLGAGAGGCIFIWFGGRNPMWLLQGLGAVFPYASGAPTFAGGVSFLLSLSSASFLAAILCHFLAVASLTLGGIKSHGRLRP